MHINRFLMIFLLTDKYSIYLFNLLNIINDFIDIHQFYDPQTDLSISFRFS